MKNLNKVMLIGVLGVDPEMVYTASGVAVTKMSLGVERVIPGKEGEPTTQATNWFKIVAWNKLAEITNQYCRKGNHIHVEGELRNRKWTTTEGETRYVTEVIALNIIFLDKKEAENKEVENTAL